MSVLNLVFTLANSSLPFVLSNDKDICKQFSTHAVYIHYLKQHVKVRASFLYLFRKNLQYHVCVTRNLIIALSICTLFTHSITKPIVPMGFSSEYLQECLAKL